MSGVAEIDAPTTLRKASELRERLLRCLQEGRQSGRPLVRVGHDEAQPAWHWLGPLLRARSDWTAAVGAAIVSLLTTDDELAAAALVDVLANTRIGVVLHPWIAPQVGRWGDARGTRNAIGWGGDGVPTLARVVAAHGTYLRDLADPDRPGCTEGPHGPRTSQGPLRSVDDLRRLLAISARRGRFAWTEWGTRLWSWLYPEGIARPWIDDALGPLVGDALAGGHTEVIAALDWLREGRDVWRYADALQAAVDGAAAGDCPWWWQTSAGQVPKGWRRTFDSAKRPDLHTLGDVAALVLPAALQQRATPPIMDLPPVGIA